MSKYDVEKDTSVLENVSFKDSLNSFTPEEPSLLKLCLNGTAPVHKLPHSNNVSPTSLNFAQRMNLEDNLASTSSTGSLNSDCMINDDEVSNLTTSSSDELRNNAQKGKQKTDLKTGKQIGSVDCTLCGRHLYNKTYNITRHFKSMHPDENFKDYKFALCNDPIHLANARRRPKIVKNPTESSKTAKSNSSTKKGSKPSKTKLVESNETISNVSSSNTETDLKVSSAPIDLAQSNEIRDISHCTTPSPSSSQFSPGENEFVYPSSLPIIQPTGAKLNEDNSSISSISSFSWPFDEQIFEDDDCSFFSSSTSGNIFEQIEEDKILFDMSSPPPLPFTFEQIDEDPDEEYQRIVNRYYLKH